MTFNPPCGRLIQHGDPAHADPSAQVPAAGRDDLSAVALETTHGIDGGNLHGNTTDWRDHARSSSGNLLDQVLENVTRVSRLLTEKTPFGFFSFLFFSISELLTYKVNIYICI
jgi:hypothetical protein